MSDQKKQEAVSTWREYVAAARAEQEQKWAELEQAVETMTQQVELGAVDEAWDSATEAHGLSLDVIGDIVELRRLLLALGLDPEQRDESYE